MSIESWVKEFYPITARAASKLNDIECTRHSLNKWKGATEVNLKKHGVEFVSCTIVQSDKAIYEKITFDFNSTSCSLCQKFRKQPSLCYECPIYKATGETCIRSYSYADDNSNPNPMIEQLEQTLKFLEKNKNDTPTTDK